MLKQSLHVSDKLRTEQMNYVKGVLQNIKIDIIECGNNIRRQAIGTEQSLRDISSSVLKRVTEIEDRVRVLDSFFDNENIVTISSLNVDTFYGRNDEAESYNTRSVDTVPNNPDVCFAEKNSKTPTEEPFISQVERRPQPFNEAMTPTNKLITSPPQAGSSG